MRVAAIERRRTGALAVAVVLAGLGVVLTVTSQPPFSEYGTWSSSWAAAGSVINDTDIVLGPLAAVAAAWVGGRERRRGMTELLGTTPRPTVHRTTLTWAALCGGVVLGMLGFAGFVALGIAPTVSYGGGRWPVAWLLAIGGVVACSAIGFAGGRLVPGRLVAPGVGVVLYVGVGVIGYFNGAWTHLTPVAGLPLIEATALRPLVALGYAGWLAALTTALVLLGAGRAQRWPAAAALLAAALVAVPLATTTDRAASPRDGWVERDPAAMRLVCTRTTPTVCTTRVHAGLLPALTPYARELLGGARRVLPVDRVVEGDPFSSGRRIRHGVLPWDDLQGRSRLLRPGLARRAGLVEEAARSVVILGDCTTYPSPQTQLILEDVASGLVLGRVPDAAGGARERRLRTFLSAEPGRARTWMREFLRATSECDVSAQRALADVGS